MCAEWCCDHLSAHLLAQNLALAVGAVAALALPALFGAIPLWAAVAFHEGSTVLVALNSLRLLSTGPTSLAEVPCERTRSTTRADGR